MERSTSRGGSGDVVGRGCLHRPGVAWGHPPGSFGQSPHQRGCLHRPEGGILPAHPANPPLYLHHIPYPYCNPIHFNKSTIEREDPFPLASTRESASYDPGAADSKERGTFFAPQRGQRSGCSSLCTTSPHTGHTQCRATSLTRSARLTIPTSRP